MDADSPKPDTFVALERWLRDDLPDSRLDYGKMERNLMERIADAEKDGPLSLMKLREIPPESFWDRAETELFTRIKNHREYEEPVDECIQGSGDLSDPAWMRLESKLDRKLRDVQALPAWERYLKADMHPSPGAFERLEEKLERQLHSVDGLASWENILKADEVLSPAILEAVEAGLGEKFERQGSLEDWEKDLKADVYVEDSRWQAIEEGLFDRMERQTKLAQLSVQPFWLGFGFYLAKTLSSKTGKAAAMLALVLAAFFPAWNYYHRSFVTLDTLIFQAQGSSISHIRSIPGDHGAIRSGPDGSLTLVNERGFVELRSGTHLEIARASESKVHYKVKLPEDGMNGQGKITFFVSPARRGAKYLVSTPDYTIEVLGTYFQVQPDLGGRLSTQILEGSVKIVSAQNETLFLSAGQSLVYDLAERKYRVVGGGQVVLRQDIEQVPSVEELKGYEILTITSDVSYAEVRIDGRYRGVTPLVILQPAGRREVSVVMEGFAALDTSIMVGDGLPNTLTLNLPPLPGRKAGKRPLAKSVRKSDRHTVATGRDALPAGRVEKEGGTSPSVAVNEGDLYYRKAEESQAADWRLAVKLYEKVLAFPGTSRLRKEASLFSIGRLRAENEGDKSVARETFLNYLALYPSGAFAGECWLRLAELEFEKNEDKAIGYYLKYFEKFPRHHRISEFQHRVGLIYLQQGRHDEAVAMFRQSLSNVLYGAEEDKRKIYGSLHKALTARGDIEGARAIQERFLEGRGKAR